MSAHLIAEEQSRAEDQSRVEEQSHAGKQSRPETQSRPADRSRPVDRARDGEDDPSASDLFDLLGDDYTRRVLDAVAERPRGGRAVAEAADVSRTTAYRRLNDLRDAGLVATDMTVDEDGHHRERFEAVIDGVDVTVADDEIVVTIGVDDC
jgi:DNA-binding transcriptional ArsR family regulator